ncbi:MlaE family ABC transporter permease [Candidatus Latescibacterota bacterium]
MKPVPLPPEISIENNTLSLTGDLVAMTLGETEKLFSGVDWESVTGIDGSGIVRFDSSGAVFIRQYLSEGVRLSGFTENALKLIDMAKTPEGAEAEPPAERQKLTLERFGGLVLRETEGITEVAVLVVDILYWSVVGIFNRKQYRKGSFTEQAYYMGSTALPIVATILFLIGAILALQSAAQLRQFGATVFVVNLVAIGLAREFAPLMTAIIISGRTGSAIASEIATMKFTEELDAIKTLGLNPVRFVVVPKFWAMVVCMPLLSILALFVGILGGFLVAITYMELSPTTFFNQLVQALMFWDVLTGLIKTLSFAVIITIVGAYRGLTFSGGADGVGRATTASVVTSIFAIIIMDSIWGILFYFKF